MPDALQPGLVITTKRLLLQPISLEDALAGLRGEAPRGLMYAPGYPDENAREGLERAVKGLPYASGGFNIVLRTRSEIIGGIGFWFPASPHRPSVGYDIVEHQRNQGYASEALKGLLEHLLAQSGIQSVEADTLESHVASRRVMEKAGMTHFHTHEVEIGGEMATLVYYEITKRSSPV